MAGKEVGSEYDLLAKPVYPFDSIPLIKTKKGESAMGVLGLRA